MRARLGWAVAACWLTLLASPPAMPAVIGEITVRSQMGEPLVAEVPIYDIQPGEEHSLIAGLAPQIAFEEAGTSRTAAIEALQFQLVRMGAQWLLKITSTEPVLKPMVGVVLELRADGKPFWREYAIVPEDVLNLAQAEPDPVMLPDTRSATSAQTRISAPDSESPSETKTQNAPVASENVESSSMITMNSNEAPSTERIATEDKTDKPESVPSASLIAEPTHAGNQITMVPPRNQRIASNDADRTPTTASGSGAQDSSGHITRGKRMPVATKDELKLLPAKKKTEIKTEKTEEDQIAGAYASKEEDERIVELEKNLSKLQEIIDGTDGGNSASQTAPAPANAIPPAEPIVAPVATSDFASLIGRQDTRLVMLLAGAVLMLAGWAALRLSSTAKIQNQ